MDLYYLKSCTIYLPCGVSAAICSFKELIYSTPSWIPMLLKLPDSLWTLCWNSVSTAVHEFYTAWHDEYQNIHQWQGSNHGQLVPIERMMFVEKSGTNSAVPKTNKQKFIFWLHVEAPLKPKGLCIFVGLPKSLFISNFNWWLFRWATKKRKTKTRTFHFTGWLTWILIMIFCNPYQTGYSRISYRI